MCDAHMRPSWRQHRLMFCPGLPHIPIPLSHKAVHFHLRILEMVKVTFSAVWPPWRGLAFPWRRSRLLSRAPTHLAVRSEEAVMSEGKHLQFTWRKQKTECRNFGARYPLQLFNGCFWQKPGCPRQDGDSAQHGSHQHLF